MSVCDDKETRKITAARKKRRSNGSGARFFLFLLVLAIGAGAFLEFRGPYQGWFRDLAGLSKPPPPEPEPKAEPPEPVDLPPPPGADDDFLAEKDGPPKEPEKTELEKRYEKLYTEALQKQKRPEIGRKCRIRLRDGTRVEGRLADVKPGKIVVQVKYGTVTYALHQVHQSFIDKLFPERAAKRKALRRLRKLRERELAASTGQSAARLPAAEPDAVVVDTREPQETPEKRKPFRYNPKPGPTPARLKPVVQAFGDWMFYQHRRVGGKIADKLYGKQQGKNVVLYMVMNPLFRQQDYDFRFQMAEGLHKFWSFRCESMGIAPLDNCHIVMLNDRGRIIGGSTVKSSADIWVEKDKGRSVARRR